MVQRKVSSKLGFQADHLLLKSNLKPICFQHQDGKNRGSDMKKKMKRSKPIKISDFDTLDSTPLKKNIPQIEKSPSLASPVTPVALQKPKVVAVPSPGAAVLPQRQGLVKYGDGSPNYMKGTSSSEARKERLRRNSSDQSEKPRKSFPVRSLTKSPSFKPVRSGAKKSSIDALCADVDVQKATCSSTLKDSKFPAYLMLNPGGTESEGTSVLKVCPYSYCSLNGHHHAPSPPLKCFLKAKRRSLKNLKSSRMQVCLSPRKIEPSCDENEGVTTDFFVEIYASGEQLERNGDNKYSSDGDDVVVDEQENKDQVSENVSGASSPQSEIDLEENFVSAFLSFLSEEARRRCNEGSDVEEGENVSEDCDMEWEEGQKETCVKVIKQFDDEAEIIRSDDECEEGGSFTEEILGDDLLQEFFCEESALCSSQFDESDSEMEDVMQNWEILTAKSEECDSDCDLGDSVNPATSMEDAIVELKVADNNDEFEMNHQLEADATDLLQCRIADSSEIFDEIDKAETNDSQKLEETEPDQSSGLDELQSDTAEDPIEEQEHVPTEEVNNEIDSANVVEIIDSLDKDEGTNKSKISTSEEPLEQNNSMILSSICSDGIGSRVEDSEIEVKTESDGELNPPVADEGNNVKSGSRYQRGSNSRDELADAFNRKWTINCRKPITDSDEEEREFNPKDPNFLPVVPDPEAEKVDLKHQDMDDRKNSEEWMIDYALQQAVTKLAPARKRKVALLVEAFEKVLPIPKYDTRQFRNNTVSAFSPRPIQACS
ncbi:Plant calmodulin-binding protein-related [Euphorbia peplus]|nr:Plant calmodulin-binding protein-related [Euphorbia peplus]